MGQLELLLRSTLAAPKEWVGEKSRLHVPILPRRRMSLFPVVEPAVVGEDAVPRKWGRLEQRT